MESVNQFARITSAGKRRGRVRWLQTVLTPGRSRGCHRNTRSLRSKEKRVPAAARAT